MNLNGKTILITGATSGIGRACAIKFDKLGVKVIATGRDSLKLESLQAEMSNEHTYIPCDLSNPEELKTMSSKLPNFDGFIHCAGISSRKLIKFSTENEVLEMMNINYFSAVNLTRELMKSRKINPNGSILYIASVATEFASAGHFIYSASKAALIAFAREMAVEFAPRKIRSNTISPGVVMTPMVESFFEKNPELKIADEKKYLLGHGKVEDIVDVIHFFMSDASKWITGTNLIVDGGYTCFK